MERHILQDVLAAKAERRAIAVVTALADGTQRIVRLDGVGGDLLENELEEAFCFDKSLLIEREGKEYFIDVHNLPLKMIVVGAAHIAQALIPIAQSTGYDVSLIDPRRAFATKERFSGVRLYVSWPDEILANIGIDERTAVIVLSHDPKIDDPALSMALESEAFYIGALGSKRTHASRLERLRERGFDDNQLARINGPIGIDIGAKGQAEIAVAIMAQVVQCLRLGGQMA